MFKLISKEMQIKMNKHYLKSTYLKEEKHKKCENSKARQDFGHGEKNSHTPVQMTGFTQNLCIKSTF